MSLRDITDDATLRMYRKEARQMGHRMSRLDSGGQYAIASCSNPGCQVMVEITGPNMHFRWIDLSDESGATNQRCRGLTTGQ